MICSLYNEDCLNTLSNIKSGTIDLIVTDPPYELENHGGGKSDLARRDLCNNTDEFVGFMSDGFNYDLILTEFVRVCKNPNMYIFCSNNQLSKLLHFFESMSLSATVLVWNKTNPVPFCNGKYLSDIEFIVYVRGKGVTFNNQTPFEYKHKFYQSSVVPNKDRLHTAQKPIDLLKRYILLSSNNGDTILDCFMGSGSTGVACVQTDRNFIGIEINKKYFDIAKNRIEQEKHNINRRLF